MSEREGTKRQAEHSLNFIQYIKIDSDKDNWRKKFTDTKKMHHGLILTICKCRMFPKDDDFFHCFSLNIKSKLIFYTFY